MKTKHTLYLVDDHQMILDGLKLLVENDERLQLLGSATDATVAYREILNKKPDLALVDISIIPGEQNGLELISSLRKAVSSTKFVVLTQHGQQRYMRDAQSWGASGYLLKHTGKEELRKCLDIVLDGGEYFPGLKQVRAQETALFTPRELEILKLIIEEDCSTAVIAERLALAVHTVSTHRRNICRKTGASTPIGFQKFMREHQINL